MNAATLAFWQEPFLVLAAGSTFIAMLAALLARRSQSAHWQRGHWQAAVLGLLALFVFELFGAGNFAVSSGRAWWQERVTFSASRPGASKPALEIAAQSPPSATPTMRADEGAVLQDTAEVASDPALFHRFATSEIDSSMTEPVQSTPFPPHAAGADQTPLAAARWPLFVWLGGLMFCLVRWSYGWLRLRRWVRAASPAEVELQLRVQSLSQSLNLRRVVRLLTLPGLAGPVAFGIWRPTIGLPLGFSRRFTRLQQDAMLAHELAHLAGRDPAWRLLADVTAAIWWWQPAAWWARGRLEAATEGVADEASLVLADGPQTLAACLVQIGKQLLRPRKLGWSGIEGGGFRSSLGRRVARLLNLEGRAWRATRGHWAIVGTIASLLALTSLAGTAWARRTIWENKGETMTIGQAWRESLGGLALLAALGAQPAVAAEGDAPAVPPPPAVERPAPPPAADKPREGGEPRREGDRDGQLERLKNEARKLREEGKSDDAARVEKEFREHLEGHLKQLFASIPESSHEKLKDRIGAYLKARDEGKFADADQIEEQIKAIVKPAEDKRPVDQRQMLHHLRGAAEHLRALGANDQADQLFEKARSLEKELGFPPMPEGRPRDAAAPEGRGPDRRRDEPRRGREGDRRGTDAERRGPDDRRDPSEAEGRRAPEGRGNEGDRPRAREGDRPREPEGDRRGGEGRAERRDGDRRSEDRRDGDRREGDRKEGDGRREGRGGEGDPQQELARVIRELRGEIESLRREVQELRGRVPK